MQQIKVNDNAIETSADLVVGADGIRSTVRKLMPFKDNDSLHYLGCIVILGICPLKKLKDLESPLLDSATVFQTANGKERIYMMPYTTDSVMWQLSFPLSEKEAKNFNIDPQELDLRPDNFMVNPKSGKLKMTDVQLLY